MGRKNRSEEKRQDILDAFENVILRDGFAGASQRKIADEAGVNQPIIHHYFSGGDELLDALLQRITERYRQALNAFITTSAQSDQDPSLEDILSFLCSAEFHQVSLQNEVMFRLIGQTKHTDKTTNRLAEVYHELLAEIRTYLEKAQVNNPEQIAYTIMCIIIGHDWAKVLGFGEHRNDMMSTTLMSLVSETNADYTKRAEPSDLAGAL